ncbi:hypothetical protein NLJ89_g11682 [Agrocybe chaxingu]|uniref:Xrn1 N-terminal domain-containing protein n=1 Tax=Agrocybe chaxingu TaxID=84603 RepID=A0A9W8MP61_9AGAR|nr:hypothetical protein NLJ89_g11682 [Agrocybe chaxingu]
MRAACTPTHNYDVYVRPNRQSASIWRTPASRWEKSPLPAIDPGPQTSPALAGAIKASPDMLGTRGSGQKAGRGEGCHAVVLRNAALSPHPPPLQRFHHCQRRQHPYNAVKISPTVLGKTGKGRARMQAPCMIGVQSPSTATLSLAPPALLPGECHEEASELRREFIGLSDGWRFFSFPGVRFHAIAVDSGVLRLNKAQQADVVLNKDLGQERRIRSKKRKTIRDASVDVFEAEAAKIEAAAAEEEKKVAEAKDVIESIGFKGPSATLKAHRNVSGLLKDMNSLSLCENSSKMKPVLLGVLLQFPHNWLNVALSPALDLRFVSSVPSLAIRPRSYDRAGVRGSPTCEGRGCYGVWGAKGEKLPEEKAFDGNCIAPGTPFMVRLSEQLRYFINKKITEDSNWRDIKVVLSGHEVPGEGEHKTVEYIRLSRAQPDYNPNVRRRL